MNPRHATCIALATAGVMLAGCVRTIADPEPAAVPPATSTTRGAPGHGGLAWQEVAAGFDQPVALVVDPRSDSQLVVELTGRIRDLQGAVVLDLTDRVTTGGERGLLDAATTPDGSALLVHYSGNDGETTLGLLPLSGGGERLADPGSEQVLLTLQQPASNHNGGSAVFGSDGMLHLALGDGGSSNDAFGHGSDPGSPLGAILRLDVTTDPGQVLVPDDNPFVDTADGDWRVWAHGLRNPWRIATDGSSWFVADVGQDAVEEVTILSADSGPHDLGWADWEGTTCRVGECETSSTQPAFTWTHDEGACSIIGGAVAAPGAPGEGRFWFTDLCDTRTRGLSPEGDAVEGPVLPAPALALDVNAAGGVVALLRDGRLLELVDA